MSHKEAWIKWFCNGLNDIRGGYVCEQSTNDINKYIIKRASSFDYKDKEFSDKAYSHVHLKITDNLQFGSSGYDYAMLIHSMNGFYGLRVEYLEMQLKDSWKFECAE